MLSLASPSKQTERWNDKKQRNLKTGWEQGLEISHCLTSTLNSTSGHAVSHTAQTKNQTTSQTVQQREFASFNNLSIVAFLYNLSRNSINLMSFVDQVSLNLPWNGRMKERLKKSRVGLIDWVSNSSWSTVRICKLHWMSHAQIFLDSVIPASHARCHPVAKLSYPKNSEVRENRKPKTNGKRLKSMTRASVWSAGFL